MWYPRAAWVIFVAVVAIPTALGNISSTSALSALPDCAINCLTISIDNSICSATNQTCICANEALQANLTACVAGTCTVKESLTTKNATMTFCSASIRHHSVNYAVVTGVLAVISGLFIIQRFALKLYSRLDVGPDDWFTLICAFVSIPITVLAIHGLVPNGMGRDIWTLEFAKIYNFGKYFLIMEVIYFAEIALLKIAMLFFYLRIFPSKLIRRALWGTIILNSLFGILFAIITIFQCKPISYSWQLWDGEHQGQCLDINAIAWSNAAISITLDIWMIAIPMVQIHSLHLNWKKKVAVGGMFCVGTFVTVVSILRLHSLVKFGAQSTNPTWEYLDAALWSTIEIHVGIICNCLPSFRLFILQLFPALQSSSERYHASYDRGPPRTKTGNRQFAAIRGSNAETAFSRNDSHGDGFKDSALGHAETDEIQLVRIRDHDNKSARSDHSFQSTL
ncbi:hypothetical protein BGZ61DRAFT_353966 [Ilyonectria robusta]|uniref:uncharacterized protein n=1 Tax=Ilyonectria robusta TaxID=1079257 RepID=UPI001E8D5AA8|nr:uncharacterized protein BGZ61DRAFT_353966 [Ilyonectria robusta]KAH8688533.1 hypothetical protein BGZ61DRAFT_353966 [Ilyonectria robusta]